MFLFLFFLVQVCQSNVKAKDEWQNFFLKILKLFVVNKICDVVFTFTNIWWFGDSGDLEDLRGSDQKKHILTYYFFFLFRFGDSRDIKDFEAYRESRVSGDMRDLVDYRYL